MAPAAGPRPRRFAPFALADLSAEQAAVAAEILANRPSLAGPFGPLLRSPVLANHLQRTGAYLRFHSPLPAQLRELAILVVARRFGADFEWHSHRPLAEQAGVNSSACDALAEGRRPVNLSKEEASIFEVVCGLLATGTITDEHFAALAVLVGEGGIIDLVALVGYYSTVAFILNVDQHPPPCGAAALPLLKGAPFG